MAADAQLLDTRATARLEPQAWSSAETSAPAPKPFAEYQQGLIHSWSRIVTMLGVALIPLFVVLDYFTMPEALLVRFATLRGLVTFAILLQYLVIRRTKPGRFSFLHGYAFSILVGQMIVVMTVDLGGFNSAYYAGLNLVIIAVNLLLPWRSLHSALNGLSITSMYVLTNLAFGGPFEVSILINNLYFMGATVVIATAINHTKTRLIEEEFRLRAELVNTNVSLDRSRHELKAARDALWGEMEVAKRIQTALLPKNKRMQGYTASAMMKPAEEVGGDYYDFIETRAGENWVCIGDVSGHGVESGLVMMMTQTSILSMVNDIPNRKPSDVFTAVNAVVRENILRLDTNRYMTLNVVRLHERTMTVTGKHQDILVYRRATKSVEVIDNDGCWLGMIPSTAGFVDDVEIPMNEGDAVLFFTDGVTEAMSRSGEMFGQDRLIRLLDHVASMPLEVALQKILEAVEQFQEKQQDDITMVMLRREHLPT